MIKVSDTGHVLLNAAELLGIDHLEPAETFDLLSECNDIRIDGEWQYGALVKRFAKRAKGISVGRNRIVFLFDSYVVKIPRCSKGEGDNDWEGSVGNAPGSDTEYEVQFPRTRLAYWRKIPIVFMERVEEVTVTYLRDMLNFHIPDWVDSVDCAQVGFTKKCRLVAFDYGLN